MLECYDKQIACLGPVPVKFLDAFVSVLHIHLTNVRAAAAAAARPVAPLLSSRKVAAPNSPSVKSPPVAAQPESSATTVRSSVPTAAGARVAKLGDDDADSSLLSTLMDSLNSEHPDPFDRDFTLSVPPPLYAPSSLASPASSPNSQLVKDIKFVYSMSEAHHDPNVQATFLKHVVKQLLADQRVQVSLPFIQTLLELKAPSVAEVLKQLVDTITVPVINAELRNDVTNVLPMTVVIHQLLKQILTCHISFDSCLLEYFMCYCAKNRSASELEKLMQAFGATLDEQALVRVLNDAAKLNDLNMPRLLEGWSRLVRHNPTRLKQNEELTRVCELLVMKCGPSEVPSLLCLPELLEQLSPMAQRHMRALIDTHYNQCLASPALSWDVVPLGHWLGEVYADALVSALLRVLPAEQAVYFLFKAFRFGVFHRIRALLKRPFILSGSDAKVSAALNAVLCLTLDWMMSVAPKERALSSSNQRRRAHTKKSFPTTPQGVAPSLHNDGRATSQRSERTATGGHEASEPIDLVNFLISEGWPCSSNLYVALLTFLSRCGHIDLLRRLSSTLLSGSSELLRPYAPTLSRQTLMVFQLFCSRTWYDSEAEPRLEEFMEQLRLRPDLLLDLEGPLNLILCYYLTRYQLHRALTFVQPLDPRRVRSILDPSIFEALMRPFQFHSLTLSVVPPSSSLPSTSSSLTSSLDVSLTRSLPLPLPTPALVSSLPKPPALSPRDLIAVLTTSSSLADAAHLPPLIVATLDQMWMNNRVTSVADACRHYPFAREHDVSNVLMSWSDLERSPHVAVYAERLRTRPEDEEITHALLVIFSKMVDFHQRGLLRGLHSSKSVDASNAPSPVLSIESVCATSSTSLLAADGSLSTAFVFLFLKLCDTVRRINDSVNVSNVSLALQYSLMSAASELTSTRSWPNGSASSPPLVPSSPALVNIMSLFVGFIRSVTCVHSIYRRHCFVPFPALPFLTSRSPSAVGDSFDELSVTPEDFVQSKGISSTELSSQASNIRVRNALLVFGSLTPMLRRRFCNILICIKFP